MSAHAVVVAQHDVPVEGAECATVILAHAVVEAVVQQHQLGVAVSVAPNEHVARMWVGVNEAGVENLVGESADEFVIDLQH